MDATDLDAGDVLIRVVCAAVNYRDALAGLGRPGGVRRFPCVGGSDLAGIVLKSAAPRFRPGDAVIATGYELGVAHHGGYSECALVPGGWVLPLPVGMSLQDAMAIGSAGLAAAMAITRMEDGGLKPENGPVVVTGATGGVGSLSIDMLATRGYEVVALTGKTDQEAYLRGLGAKRVMQRQALALDTILPLDKGLWAGAVDVLGGKTLAWLLASARPTATLASIGSVADTVLQTNVLPFVSRGVSLAGIDSMYAGFGVRERAWLRLAGDLRPRHLQQMTRSIHFDELPDAFDRLIAGLAIGRAVVQIAPTGE